MEIKKKRESALGRKSLLLTKYLFRGLISRKSRIFLFILTLFIVFTFGNLSGLLVRGYFGTFDQPSENLQSLLHRVGIDGLRDLRLRAEGLAKENVRIPLNYLKGKTSNPEKIVIDIKFKDWKAIELKRKQALEIGLLISSPEDLVPATIKADGKEVRVDLRLKGDLTDHLEKNKWSFRIKVKNGETLFGMKEFSIQNPRTKSYLNQYLYSRILQREDILAPRYDFVEVIINGENKGIFALEEHFEKQLLEYNQRREGVIIKFNEDFFWLEKLNRNYSSDLEEKRDEFRLYYSSDIIAFNQNKVLEDPLLYNQFIHARNLLESFRKGDLSVSEVFDEERLAKYFALNTLTGSNHGSRWHNVRFYFNPLTSNLEPIGWDQVAGAEAYSILESYLQDCVEDLRKDCSSENELFWWDGLFKDKKFYQLYIKELERISEKEYLDNLFVDLEGELDEKINYLRKDDFLYIFSEQVYYQNQNQIKSKINPVKGVNAYLHETPIQNGNIVLYVGNILEFPVEIDNLFENTIQVGERIGEKIILQPRKGNGPIEYKKIEFRTVGLNGRNIASLDLKLESNILGSTRILLNDISPWEYVSEDYLKNDFIRNSVHFNASAFSSIEADSETVYFKKGHWRINETIAIPNGFILNIGPGTTIDLVSGAMILSYSPINIQGTSEEPVTIYSSDRTGQGLAVIEAGKQSSITYTKFENLRNPDKSGFELTGAITFYKSPVNIKNVSFENITSEDNLNIFNSEYEISWTSFKNCAFDCIDVDFSNGTLGQSNFINCGNDCIDFSGSNGVVSDININAHGDKGISVGEASKLEIKDILIKGIAMNRGTMGVAVKDSSVISLTNSDISNVIYAVAVYQKKSEFGPASITIRNLKTVNVDENTIIEKGSILILDDKSYLSSETGVYEKIYDIK